MENMERHNEDFFANSECPAISTAIPPPASSVDLIRFRNMWTCWLNVMIHYYLVLQYVRIITEKLPGVDFTFSGTKVG